MTRILYIGDVHSTPEDLDECASLFDCIERVSKDNCQKIVFLGDQFNTFDTLSIRSLNFWEERLSSLLRIAPVILLVGNHDRVGPKDETNRNSMASFSRMEKFGNRVTVIDRVDTIAPGVVGVAYMHTSGFVAALDGAKNLVPSGGTIVCHQEFNGAKYDNGFFVKDGVPMEAVEGYQVLSGHIHTGGEFGNVWYPGSPRWINMNDANEIKGIWIVEHGDDGRIVSRDFETTHGVVPKIWRFEDTPEAPIDLDSFFKKQMKPGDMPVVFVHGDSERVMLRSTYFRTLGCTTRSCITNQVSGNVKESLGIDQAFGAFFQSYQPPHKTDPQILAQELQERIGVR